MEDVQILSFRTYFMSEFTRCYTGLQTFHKMIQCILSLLYLCLFNDVLSSSYCLASNERMDD